MIYILKQDGNDVITFSLLIFKIVTAKPYISRNDHT